MQIFTALEPISGQTAAHAKRLIQKGNSPPCRENGTRIFCYKYPFLLLQIPVSFVTNEPVSFVTNKPFRKTHFLLCTRFKFFEVEKTGCWDKYL